MTPLSHYGKLATPPSTPPPEDEVQGERATLPALSGYGPSEAVGSLKTSNTKESLDDSDEYALPKFKGLSYDDYNLWRFSLKSALRGEQYCKQIHEYTCPARIKEKTEAILVSGLGDAALRTCMSASPDVIKMIDLLDKRYASRRAASRIAILTSVFSKRCDDSRNMSRFIAEFNQSFAHLEAMGDDAKIPDTLKAPIFLASFRITSTLEPSIAVIRTKDIVSNWEQLTADLILEASRVRESR